MHSDLEVSLAAQQLRRMWEHKAWSDQPLSAGWDAAFEDWITKFGYSRVADAVQMAAAPRFSDDGERLSPNIRDIPRFAAVEHEEDREPGMKDCYLVRGRMRQKFYCEEHNYEVLTLLRRAMRAGVPASAMHHAVDENTTLEDCFLSMGIDRTEFRVAMGHPISDLRLKPSQVFIRIDDPEWHLWDKYLRKTTGKGAPISKDGGWYFPSRIPPTDPLPKKARRKKDDKDSRS
ncbi:hypothetical protein AB7783_11720 [Tardiphaga sp. 172_B4_N1_3]|uniref:hypothetical protein n=1 Tax=Tardiphaga sp. 172_B4_N1_3 TaxID=3240787 RepID=UPI003F8B9C0E